MLHFILEERERHSSVQILLHVCHKVDAKTFPFFHECALGNFRTNTCTEWKTSVLVLKIPGFDSVCQMLLKLLIEQVIL